MRILIVEDDRALLRALTIGLRSQGYDALPVADGRSALDAVRGDDPDLLVLDLGLPDVSGLDVLRDVRQRGDTPVIVLSARSSSQEKVQALDLGADDYVTKPFAMDELLARIRVVGRRTDTGPEVVVTADFTLDLTARVATTTAGEDVHLTPHEWGLVEQLARRPGRLVTQRDLLRHVWGPGFERESKYLRVYLGSLRKKLEPEPSRPRYLITVAGTGYRFEPGSSPTGQSGG
ncbi:MAG: response regulator transcription factor [Nocardioidaceae bacterium]